MYKKMTPQEYYETYRNVAYELKQKGLWSEKRELPPPTWEEVSEEDKARFAQMALRVNSISAEFREDTQHEN